MLQSDFFISKQTDDFIYIVDSCLPENRSVTNDADNVCLFLWKEKQLNNRRIFYRDSMGNVDEMVHYNGRFLNFSPGCDDANLF
jgi:hypothetical protein